MDRSHLRLASCSLNYLPLADNCYNCATETNSNKGAWWYNANIPTSMEIIVLVQATGGPVWHSLAHGKQNAMKFTGMKLRPRD